MGAPRATQPVIRNAILAAQECGVVVGEIVVEKDGAVRIIAHKENDELQSDPVPLKWGATG
jgi:hypothetical protein